MLVVAPAAPSVAIDASALPPRSTEVTFETRNGPESVTLEVACTLEQRAKGLMGRTSVPANAGMIFLLPEPRVLNMWMRDTPLALDMVFFDKNRKISKIERNVQGPSDRIVSSGPGALGVIELAAGQAKTRKIERGIKILYDYPQHLCE